MKHLSLSIFSERTGGISLADVRMSRLVYFLAYTLELVLFAARGQFLPIGADLFGIRGWTFVHTAHTIASLVFMLLWTKKFKKLIRVAVAIMLGGFIPFVFLPMGYARMAFGALFYIGLGGAVTACRCGFAFAVNNAERLVGMVIMFFSVAVIRFVRSLGADGVFVTYVLPLALLFGLCYCLLRFREGDLEVKEKTTGSDVKGLYWAFALFALYFAVDGYNASLITGKGNPDFLYFFIGMLIAGVILFLAIARFRLNTWHIWNIFFVAAFGMGLLAAFSGQMGTEKPEYFCAGLSMIGWPLCIYTLSCAMRRFASYELLKKCTLIYVVLSPVIVSSSDLAETLAPGAFPIVAMLFILVFGIGFLMVSPFSYQHLFSSEWLPEMYSVDMARLKEKVEDSDRFGDYQLTPRQKEVAVMLLAAKTRRQIAGELKLSESTVKMHTGELYKRLGINSRAELFRMFGVAEAGGAEKELNI